jgi:hypothetical protein
VTAPEPEGKQAPLNLARTRVPSRKGQYLKADPYQLTRELGLTKDRREGVDYDELAARYGYKTGRGAKQALERLLKQVKSAEVAEYRELCTQLHLEQVARTLERIRNPGFKHNVRGDVLTGPDGEPELDVTAQNDAEDTLTKILAGLRKLHGTDAPVKRELTIEEKELDKLLMVYVGQLPAPATYTQALPAPEPADVHEGEWSELPGQ